MTTAERILDRLGAYSLKEERPGHYRSNSPLRDGSDSHSFVVVVEPGGEYGAYFDHVTGEGGSLWELARQLKLVVGEQPEPQTVTTTKRAYMGISDYAMQHGVAAEVFEAVGWREFRSHEGRPALAFETATGTRLRYLDGNVPHYRSPLNYVTSWYRIGEAIEIAKRTDSPLVLCNGEASVVVGQTFELAATCVTGSGERVLSAERLGELVGLWRGRIIVALDCDKKGREAAPLLTGQLVGAGYDAAMVEMGLGPSGDLADFCRLHRMETRDALKSLVRRKEGLIEWVRGEEIMKVPPVSWLIPGELPQRALIVLFGQPGSGKSFVALDYSLRLAQTQVVLYVAAEGFGGYADRIIAWTQHFCLGSGDLWFAGGNKVVSLLDSGVAEAFIASAKPMKPCLIVFDTLAWAMMGGEENAVKDMQLLINHCRRIQEQTGAAVMLVHHSGKAGGVERGSSALRGGADMMIEINNDDDIITVSCSKSKDAEPFPRRFLKRQRVVTRGDQTSLVWLPIESVPAQKRGDTLTTQQLAVLQALSSPVFRVPGARLPQLSDALPDMSRRTLYKILNRLMGERLGYVTQDKRGEPYKITEAGLAALGLS